MANSPFNIGETVADRDRNDPKPAIVVNLPPQTVDEWIAYTNTTVAEDNPDYPADAAVIVVVYRHEPEEFDSDWPDHDGPFSLAELNEAGVSHCSFPAPRLTSLTTNNDSEAGDAAVDATDSESENERVDEGTNNAGASKSKSERESPLKSATSQRKPKPNPKSRTRSILIPNHLPPCVPSNSVSLRAA